MSPAQELAKAGVLPGAVARNWDSYGGSVRLGSGVEVRMGSWDVWSRRDCALKPMLAIAPGLPAVLDINVIFCAADAAS